MGTQPDMPEKRPDSDSSLASSFHQDSNIESDKNEPRKSNVDAAVTQSPPRQSMDRTDDDPAISPSKYRIPSHVFARNTSTAPHEWSIASSESLFSIHPGNMSFTGDQLAYFKSGELGLPGENNIIPADPASTAHPSSATNKSTESENVDDARFGVTETTAPETTMEVKKVNEEDPLKKKPPSVKELPPTTTPPPNIASHSVRSDDSMGSVKSFAFPILTGMDKSGSSKPGKTAKQPQSQPETPSQTKEEEDGLKDSIEPPPDAQQNKWCCISCC
ncbi:hypothetical protein ACFE04_005719 [Oxalis oulophora]